MIATDRIIIFAYANEDPEAGGFRDVLRKGWGTTAFWLSECGEPPKDHRVLVFPNLQSALKSLKRHFKRIIKGTDNGSPLSVLWPSLADETALNCLVNNLQLVNLTTLKIAQYFRSEITIFPQPPPDLNPERIANWPQEREVLARRAIFESLITNMDSLLTNLARKSKSI